MNLYATANNVNFTIFLCQKINDENVKFEKYNSIRSILMYSALNLSVALFMLSLQCKMEFYINFAIRKINILQFEK